MTEASSEIPNEPARPSPRALLERLGAVESLLLAGHENPDGDCLGSQVALYHLLVQRGKRVVIHNPDPLPAGLSFLGARTPFDAYRPGVAPPEGELVVLLDCARRSRLGPLGEALAGRDVAVIDHHVGSEDGDGAVHFVDVTAPSTGCLVHRLYGALGEPISPAAAEGVFLSLVADTGWFRFSNTTPEAFRIAREMVDAGVEPAALYDRMHRQNHPDGLAVMASVLAGARFEHGGKLVYATLDKAMMDRVMRIGFDTDLLLEPLRSTVGVEVVALLKERFDGGIKLSLRARDRVDVQRVAAAFGGGGHTKAAGASVALDLATAVERVVESVGGALAEDGAG